MAVATSTLIALTIASGVAQAVGQSRAASAQKSANARSRELIIRNQNLQIQALNNREEQDAKRASEAMFDNQRQAEASISQARVSAGESGVSGLSVDALLGDLAMQGAENKQDILTNYEFGQEQRILEAQGIGITSESQINQLPAVQSPDYLGIALNTATSAAGTYMAGDISSLSPTAGPSIAPPPTKPFR